MIIARLRFAFNGVNWSEDIYLPDGWNELSENEKFSFLTKAKELSLARRIRCTVDLPSNNGPKYV